MKMQITEGPFEPTLESLHSFECPEWFRDAKLGFWSHWGPQSVTLYGDWYARNMYIEGSDQYRYHTRVYGHPSKFGYKDLVKLWKAEKFDPEALMSLYVEAGARYFVSQGVHHDNFDNWNSQYHEWNSVKIGPKKDIVDLWHQAAKKFGLRFGVSEHLGASLNWFSTNKGMDKEGPYAGIPYDGNDPAYGSLYHPTGELTMKTEDEGFFTNNPWFHQKWFERIKDLIDQHKPDLLYSDQDVFKSDANWNIVAHLYNTSAKEHSGINEALYNQKNKDPELNIGVLDIERGVHADISPYPWQTDTCVGGWFYDVRTAYKKPHEIIEMLIDVVSKNGNLLLNIPQRPDGTLDDECLYIIQCMTQWIKINGEGIYSTRPWKTSGEGSTSAATGAFSEKALEWTDKDFRFTSNKNIIYIFQMGASTDGMAVVKSLSTVDNTEVKSAELLGIEGFLNFSQTAEGLTVELPKNHKPALPLCLRIVL
jgi:alpha-L-fucosidase